MKRTPLCLWLAWSLCACVEPSPEPTTPPSAPPAPSEPAAPAVEAPAPAQEPTTPGVEAPTPEGQQTPRAAICPKDEKYGAPVAEGATPTLLEEGFVFVEGPVWSDQLHALLFSEMDFGADGSNGPPSKIHLLTEDKRHFVFLENGGSNGLAIDENGLLACTHDTQAVSRIDLTTKERTVVVPSANGKHFNSPNDLVLSSTGDIYFTDPDWQLGKRPNETGITGVYWASPDGKVTLVDGKLSKPNGIQLSPDEKTLYVGANDGRVYRYRVDQGLPKGPKEFARVDGPDGFAVDCAGNLYVASHGPGKIEVFDPAGKKLRSIAVAPKTTNVAFGGSDRRTLFITAGSGVYSLQTQVPGYPY